MARLPILLTTVSILCCTETRKSKDLMEVSNKVEVLEIVEESNLTNGNKVSKLDRLTVWTNSTRILELPFKANFDTTTEGAFRVKFWETDSIFRKDFQKAGGDVYLMGLLSDTSNFYGFAFVSIAAVGNPGLVTFDKSGNKVDLKLLTKENCVIYAGDILLCKEYTTIGKDWSLDYYFKSVVYGAGDSGDTVCSHSISKGQISKRGEIDVGLLTEIDCKN